MRPAATQSIYYGLGVTEHSQGSTMVLGMANLAMATGNLGREGRRRQPAARTEQRAGIVRYGIVPARAYRLPAYFGRRDALQLRSSVGVSGALYPEPGLRIPNMFDAALDGRFKGLYVQGEDIVQSDPNTHHVTAGLAAMECVVVHDIFFNETASYAHVFYLDRRSWKRRDLHQFRAAYSRVRKVMPPLAGRPTGRYLRAFDRVRLSDALRHPSEVMDEIARLTPTFAGVNYEKLDRLGRVQWPCNDKAPEGTPVMQSAASCAARAAS